MKYLFALALSLAIFAAGPALAQEVVDPPAEPPVEEPVEPDPVVDPDPEPVDPEPEPVVDPDPAPVPGPAPVKAPNFLDAEDAQEILALNSALSLPAWLENGERFAISGGVGFSDGSTAFGATGILRLQGSVSGFAGAAFSESGEWAGKAGLRAGF